MPGSMSREREAWLEVLERRSDTGGDRLVSASLTYVLEALLHSLQQCETSPPESKLLLLFLESVLASGYK